MAHEKPLQSLIEIIRTQHVCKFARLLRLLSYAAAKSSSLRAKEAKLAKVAKVVKSEERVARSVTRRRSPPSPVPCVLVFSSLLAASTGTSRFA